MKNAVPVAVTNDRTWQKEYDWDSLFGVVISIEIRDVLDFEVKSKHCFKCRSCTQ